MRSTCPLDNHRSFVYNSSVQLRDCPMKANSAHRISVFVLVAAFAASPGTAATPAEVMQSNYPRESLALGEQGAVNFSVELDEHARIESCVVTKSSGYARLDAATCDLIVQN